MGCLKGVPLEVDREHTRSGGELGERFGCLKGRPLHAVPGRPGEWWQAHNIQALNARLLHRAELSEADLFKLACEDYSVMYICN